MSILLIVFLFVLTFVEAQEINESPHLRFERSGLAHKSFKTRFSKRRSQFAFLNPGELASPLWYTSLNGDFTNDFFWLKKNELENEIHIEWGNEIGDAVLQESKIEAINNYVPMVNLLVQQNIYDQSLNFNFSAVDHGSTRFQGQRKLKMNAYGLSSEEVTHRPGNIPDVSTVDLSLKGKYYRLNVLNNKYWINNFGQEEYVDHKGFDGHFENKILSSSLSYNEITSTEIDFEKFSWVDSKLGVDLKYLDFFLRHNSEWSDIESIKPTTEFGLTLIYDSEKDSLYSIEFELWQEKQMKVQATLDYDFSLFELHLLESIKKDILPNERGFFLDSNWRDLEFVQNSFNAKVYRRLKGDLFSTELFTGLNHYASDLNSRANLESLNWNGSVYYFGSQVEYMYKSSLLSLNILYQSPQFWESGSTKSLNEFKGVGEWEQDWKGGLYTHLIYGAYKDSEEWFQKLDLETIVSLNKRSLMLEMTLVNLFGEQLDSRDRFSLYVGINYFPSW